MKGTHLLSDLKNPVSISVEPMHVEALISCMASFLHYTKFTQILDTMHGLQRGVGRAIVDW